MCQIRGVWPSRTNIPGCSSALLFVTGPFSCFLLLGRNVIKEWNPSPTQRLKFWPPQLWWYFSIRIFYFLYYFSSFHFIFIHISFLFFFFLFLVFLLHTRHTAPPPFYFLFHLKNIPALHIRERERDRESLGLHRVHLHLRSNISIAARRPPHRSAWVRSACSFFFFSYLLVLIQLYFKNWILFCIWIVWEMGLDRLVIFFFFSFFFSYLLVLIQLFFKN